jgi:hypothetical protein
MLSFNVSLINALEVLESRLLEKLFEVPNFFLPGQAARQQRPTSRVEPAAYLLPILSRLSQLPSLFLATIYSKSEYSACL